MPRRHTTWGALIIRRTGSTARWRLFSRLCASTRNTERRKTTWHSTWAALNRGDLAEEAYRQAIELDRQTGKPSEQPYMNLAGLLLDHNQVTEALALLDAARRIEPRSKELEALRGRGLLLENRLNEAEAAFRAALAVEPSSGALHYQLGRVLRREGKAAEARQEFERTKALMGTHSTPPS